MAVTAATRSQPLYDAPEHKCPLCSGLLPTKGLLRTPDFTIMVRDSMVAQFTAGEAMVLRALFNASGFRLSRGQLIDAMYVGADPPLQAEHVLRTHTMNMRAKLVPLDMGMISDSGIVSLVFTAPGRRK